MYEITDYSKQQAKKLGVQIKPSQNANKKIDVFKNGEKIVSIGAKGYKDFPTFTNEKGLAFAKERQRLYKIRHKNNNGLAGFYADKILW